MDVMFLSRICISEAVASGEVAGESVRGEGAARKAWHIRDADSELHSSSFPSTCSATAIATKKVSDSTHYGYGTRLTNDSTRHAFGTTEPHRLRPSEIRCSERATYERPLGEKVRMAC